MILIKIISRKHIVIKIVYSDTHAEYIIKVYKHGKHTQDDNFSTNNRADALAIAKVMMMLASV